MKCSSSRSQPLPTNLNRFINGLSVWTGAEVVARSFSGDKEDWNPDVDSLTLYVVPGKIEDSNLQLRPYSVTIKPDLTCFYRVQKDVFESRLRNTKNESISNVKRLSVLQAQVSYLSGTLDFMLHVEDSKDRTIIGTKYYSLNVNMVTIN